MCVCVYAGELKKEGNFSHFPAVAKTLPGQGWLSRWHWQSHCRLFPGRRLPLCGVPVGVRCHRDQRSAGDAALVCWLRTWSREERRKVIKEKVIIG